MKKKDHMKEAAKFSGEDKAYVHCEVAAGITQCCVTGDPKAIIYGCYRILQRTSELTDFPFGLMLQALEDFKESDHAERGDL